MAAKILAVLLGSLAALAPRAFAATWAVINAYSEANCQGTVMVESHQVLDTCFPNPGSGADYLKATCDSGAVTISPYSDSSCTASDENQAENHMNATCDSSSNSKVDNCDYQGGVYKVATFMGGGCTGDAAGTSYMTTSSCFPAGNSKYQKVAVADDVLTATQHAESDCGDSASETTSLTCGACTDQETSVGTVSMELDCSDADSALPTHAPGFLFTALHLLSLAVVGAVHRDS